MYSPEHPLKLVVQHVHISPLFISAKERLFGGGAGTYRVNGETENGEEKKMGERLMEMESFDCHLTELILA